MARRSASLYPLISPYVSQAVARRSASLRFDLCSKVTRSTYLLPYCARRQVVVHTVMLTATKANTHTHTKANTHNANPNAKPGPNPVALALLEGGSADLNPTLTQTR